MIAFSADGTKMYIGNLDYNIFQYDINEVANTTIFHQRRGARRQMAYGGIP